MAKRQNKLKIQILEILEKYPKSRDSDQWLTIKLWCVYFPSRIHEEVIAYDEDDKATKTKKYIYLDDIMELPREDDVKRIRAVIQNVEKQFLPTSWAVAKQRKIKQEEWEYYIRNLK